MTNEDELVAIVNEINQATETLKQERLAREAKEKNTSKMRNADKPISEAQRQQLNLVNYKEN